jgi:hypothetical protein
MALEQFVVLLRVLLAGTGVALAYRGWWIHERFIMLQGFIAGGIVGAGIGVGAQSSGTLLIGLVIAGGVIGSGVALAVERLLVVGGGFIFGALIGAGISELAFGTFDTPLAFIVGIPGALLTWRLYRYGIILYTSAFGALFVSLGLTTDPLSPLFALVLMSGFFVQWRTFETDDEMTLTALADDFVEGGAPASIKVLSLFIVFINIMLIFQFLTSPANRPSGPAQAQLEAAIYGATLTVAILIPVVAGLWVQHRLAWYVGLIVFVLMTISTPLVGSAGFVFTAPMVYLLWKHRHSFLGHPRGEFVEVPSTES